MTRPDIRRRRRAAKHTQTLTAAKGTAPMTAITPTTATAPTVNLRSQKSIDKLLRDLQDSDRRARDAHEKGTAALNDAERIAQTIGELNQREDAIRQELDLIAQKRAEFQQREEDARAYAKSKHSERDAAADEAADSRALLEAAGVQVDPNLLVPASPNGQVAVPPTKPMAEVDPTGDPQLDEHMRVFNAAHDEHAAADPGVDL